MSYFVSNLLAFYAIVFAVTFVTAFVTFKRKGIKLKNYFSGEGKGAIASACLALVLIAVIALGIFLIPNNVNANPFSDMTYFNDAGVYLGVDYTRKPSPQCERDDPTDNRGTSNLGAWMNIAQSADKTLRVNAQYTHHSCYLGEDDKSYDGFGVRVEWWLWKRK